MAGSRAGGEHGPPSQGADPAEGGLVRAIGRNLREPSTSWIAAGSLVGGIASYLFQIAGTRTLGDVGYAPISVLWTLQYLIYAVPLPAVEAHVTRTVTLHPDDAALVRRSTLSLVVWLVATAVAAGVLTGLASDRLYDGLEDLALVLAAIVLSYGAFVLVRGRLAGGEQYVGYGLATGGESSARLVFAVAVLATIGTTRSLAWIMPLGPLVVVAIWLGWRARSGAPRLTGRRRAAPSSEPPVEPAAGEEAGVPAVAGLPASATGRFMTATVTANGVAQLLLAGGPLALVALRAPAAEVSVFFVTITAARVPLVFALGGVLSRLLPPLTRLAVRAETGRIRQIALLTGAGTLAVAAVAAVAAAAIGPQVVAAFFGAAFTPSRLFVALAASGALLATGTLLLNQIIIATGRELLLPAPWLLALAVAGVVIALVDAGPTIRVATAFVAGEAVALACLLAAAWYAAATPRTTGH